MSQSDWIALATAACTDAGIMPDPIKIITTWEQTFSHIDLFRNNAVFRVGPSGHILKLYGTGANRHAAVERAALTSVADAIPAPTVIAHGSFDDEHPYMIMSAIPGRTLQDALPVITPDERHAVAAQIGRITATYHRLPVDNLAAVEAEYTGRNALIDEESANRIAEIQAMQTLSPAHRDELIAFTHQHASTVKDHPSVLTHSDLSWAHIYVDGSTDGLVVSGFIDWAEAMVGPAEWDLAFHWHWTVSGDAELMQTLLDAYYAEQDRPADCQRRCFLAHYYTYSMAELWEDVKLPHVASGDSYVEALMNAMYPSKVFGKMSDQ